MKKLLLLSSLVIFASIAWTAFGQAPAPAPPASAPVPAPPAPAAPPVAATPAPPPPPASAHRDEPEANSRELVELVMAVKLTKDLGLNDEQTILMVRKLSEFRDEMGALRKERQQASKELRSAIQAKEPESQIETKLNALIAVEDKTTAFRKEKFAKLGEGLSPDKRAILYVFVNDFESEMKQLIQKVKERREQLMGGPSVGGFNPQGGQQGGAIRDRMIERMQNRLGNESNTQSGQPRERRREGGRLLDGDRQAPPLER